MAKQVKDRVLGGLGDVAEALPTERLAEQGRDLAAALGERAVTAAADRVGDLADRLLDYAENGSRKHGGDGGSHSSTLGAMAAAGVKHMVKKKFGGGRGGGGGKLKVVNIIEETEVGVPVRVAYNQWTQFQDFPKFTKKVETVEQQSDEKVAWKAGIFLSHRRWESTIQQQVPDEMIVWRSKGEKGYVDGAVTFHALTPNLTKILLVLEYHPQGFMERTGNIWRAQGRRARLELKHFRRHVMTHTILDPDSVEGWRGEIRDGKVVKSHEDALDEEREQQGEAGEEEPEDEYGGAEDEGEPAEAESAEDDEERPDEEYDEAYGDEEEGEDREDRDDEDRYPEDENDDEDDRLDVDEDEADEADEADDGGADEDEDGGGRNRASGRSRSRRSPARR